MIKKEKLKKIKKIRKLRDEILICNNIGRIKYLMFKFPNVLRIDTQYINDELNKAEIKLIEGYTYLKYGKDSLKELTLIAYNQLLKIKYFK